MRSLLGHAIFLLPLPQFQLLRCLLPPSFHLMLLLLYSLRFRLRSALTPYGLHLSLIEYFIVPFITVHSIPKFHYSFTAGVVHPVKGYTPLGSPSAPNRIRVLDFDNLHVLH